MIYFIDLYNNGDESILEYLKELGYETLVATSEEEAVSNIEAGRIPKVIIVDSDLNKIKEISNTINDALNNVFAPIIWLKNSSANIVDGLNQGAHDFILKSEVPDILNARITALLKFTETQNKIQEEVNKLKMEMDQMNRVIPTIIHDLRSPLSAIKMNNEALMGTIEDLDFDTKLIFMGTIDNQVIRGLQLVNNLLDIYKLKSGKFELETQMIALSDILAKSYPALNKLATEKSISLVLDADDELIVECDFEKMEQIVFNLVSNAIKFTNSGGSIIIKTEPSGDNEKVIVSVKDSGVGIPEEEAPNLFEEYKQTSSKSTGGEKGTGLGLVITKKLIEAHKGKIWVKSKVGEGTTFFFDLPRIKVEG